MLNLLVLFVRYLFLTPADLGTIAAAIPCRMLYALGTTCSIESPAWVWARFVRWSLDHKTYAMYVEGLPYDTAWPDFFEARPYPWPIVASPTWGLQDERMHSLIPFGMPYFHLWSVQIYPLPVWAPTWLRVLVYVWTRDFSVVAAYAMAAITVSAFAIALLVGMFRLLAWFIRYTSRVVYVTIYGEAPRPNDAALEDYYPPPAPAREEGQPPVEWPPREWYLDVQENNRGTRLGIQVGLKVRMDLNLPKMLTPTDHEAVKDRVNSALKEYKHLRVLDRHAVYQVAYRVASEVTRVELQTHEVVFNPEQVRRRERIASVPLVPLAPWLGNVFPAWLLGWCGLLKPALQKNQ